MNLNNMMGYVVDMLQSGLTGGSAELPLPDNVMLNWLMPGMPFHESAFDFAVAGPFAGPSPQTLDYFKDLVATIQGQNEGMERDKVIDEAKRMYQQHLLGTWEQWSRLVDFIPLPSPKEEDLRWNSKPGQGKHGHVSVVYGQAGQTLSNVYRDTLIRCEVADEQLTKEQKKLVKRMRALLTEEVEVEDFLTGEVKTEHRDSRAMTVYNEKKVAYENAVVDYASRLARSQSGTAEDLIEWNRSGGIYRSRATQALRDWIATGYKNDVERAQATLSHILGSSMVQWKSNLTQIVNDIENTVSGQYGYPFYPATLLPGGFARSQGWTKFAEHSLHQHSSYKYSSKKYGGRAGLNLGLFRIGGGASRKTEKIDTSFTSNRFGVSFEYTTVEIVRPFFSPNFFLSRGWRPKDSFVRDYGALHSDGEDPPKGAMVGYPTKALFVRNLRIVSSELASELEMRKDEIKTKASFGWGPFSIGGHYQSTNKSSESNLQIDGASITIRGLQLVGFMSALFPYTANPSPEVKKWI